MLGRARRARPTVTRGRAVLCGALLLGLFGFRMAYGLCSEFWFDDELQIYLIGLKSFATRTWPFLGPDVVYTHTQIPGALQGLLVALPFFLAPLPEAPTVFLNVLTFASLSFFAWYVCKRFPRMPTWVVWSWIMISPWTINYGTRVVNPSYVLVFSAPFFVAFLETFLYGNDLVGRRSSLFLMGLAIACILQLHLSWVLLPPFAVATLARLYRRDGPGAFRLSSFFAAGLMLGLATLIPTFLQDAVRTPSVRANVVFDPGAAANLAVIPARFFAFASYQVAFWMGPNDAARLGVLKAQPWMAPFAAFLLAVGFLQVVLFVTGLVLREKRPERRELRWVILGALVLTFVSFFFSIKEPTSHTFVVLMPLALFWSFHCYEWLFERKKAWLTLFKVAVICGFLFNAGMGIHSLRDRSLYRDRSRVVRAIDRRDYRELGIRRSDVWGYGY